MIAPPFPIICSHSSDSPMRWFRCNYILTTATAMLALAFTGCGTTRSTDTNRTATEQLLVSDAIDRALQSIDLHALSGQSVYFDDTKLTDTVDKNYLISSLRQYLLSNGCKLREKREDADFIVEARAGAVGTDRSELLFGVPSMNVPQIALMQPVPAAIPEIPIAKRKDQRGVAKIAVFAYHRQTGAPVWQSGLVHEESSANDVWILGTGPFQRGTIYSGTEFAGAAIRNESKPGSEPQRLPSANLTKSATFKSPQQFAQQTPAADQKVAQASHHAPVPAASTAVPASTPAPPQPATTTAAAPSKASMSPSAATTPASPPAKLSTNAEQAKSDAAKSAYLQPGDASALPQPRFNSPQ